MVDKPGFPPRGKKVGGLDGLERLLAKAKRQKLGPKGQYRSVSVADLPGLINPRGKRQTLLYLGPANDVWRPLLLTNAAVIVFADITDHRSGILKNLNTNALPGEVRLKTPWMKITDNKWSLLINFKGQDRKLIYAVGDATERLPEEVANGYDILLTSASEYVLVDSGKGFRTIVGPLRKGGHYLSAGDMAESQYGFTRVAVASEVIGPDRRISFVLGYYLVEKVSNPTAPDSHFVELKIKKDLSDAACGIGGGIQWIEAAVRGRQAESAPDSNPNFVKIRREFAAHFAAIMRLMGLLRELGALEAKDMQKSYATRLLKGSNNQKFAELWSSGQLQQKIRTAFPEKAQGYIEDLGNWFVELQEMAK